MSKEISDIVYAFEQAARQNRLAALATVVHVDGSSYRRPGARMLVEDNGQLTGAISGGCLEGDALRKARLAIHQQQNSLVVYDTTDDDDLQFGVKLGCNGIVYILFEPINPAAANNPIALLKQALSKRRDAVIITLFAAKPTSITPPGTCFLGDGSMQVHCLPPSIPLSPLTTLQERSLATKQSFLEPIAGQEWQAFVEFIPPPLTLLVVGAGNDAMPMLAIAQLLGWESIVADGRDTHATPQRFPSAKEVIIAKPDALKDRVRLDEHCCVLLMTHNYNYDLAVLKWLLNENCFYIGLLGPKKRLSKMMGDLSEQGVLFNEAALAKIHGPTGLDIGAETAAEIALSVLSEIKAVHEKRQAGFLKDRPRAIHDRMDEEPFSKKSKTAG